MAAGIVEYLLEARAWPSMKLNPWAMAIGMALIVTGEIIRKTAMVTAAQNFTHSVARRKHPEHQLVTRGIYAWVRHPGYLGWGLWALGTQVLLANPICVLVFAAVVWKFFQLRIADEDALLHGFFNSDWREYRRSVPSGLPFIP